MKLDRRAFLLTATALAACTPAAPNVTADAAQPDTFANSPFRKLTTADWQARLPAASFDVLRHEGTEAPFSSPLNNEHRHGTFACLGCGLALFKSDWKFDSGTGWPSFYTEIEGALVKKADFAIIEERTEYHCAQCLGHQGHVFTDGPRPTGLRYCNNGVALKFIPA
ncbi:MAG TPA: peptide-methionine (R)-S-oxide reductase MsrB [Caulobacteraceae bacterium]|jgi:peptide-methionine (R)-S-oxide reductase|nr:peptide-methionine (R)-S-oxide reductase MsrB [Caulobacteraceae bacterium]